MYFDSDSSIGGGGGWKQKKKEASRVEKWRGEERSGEERRGGTGREGDEKKGIGGRVGKDRECGTGGGGANMLLEVETANGRATVDLLSSSYRGDGAPFLVAVDIFDKLGLAAIPRPRTVGEQGDGCPKILYGDTLEKISIHLPPRSLKRFSCTCKHLRLHCSGDDLWRPWLCRLLGSGRSRAKRDGDVKSAGGGEIHPPSLVFVWRCWP